ncbi:methyltransferase domain-containing protein [Pontibacter sp. JH31]|uniref:Methyltransferase domain-containing protein n=1 Tax=Pontibacter aquaedesilientis TaxID=2766980 RepID=A0ABR7XJC8_9BACT|nr:class I SAM-dependent methyltransferase [Pontibacter aquaedesilientis]MBD1397723.1 methyltransferase domain-containing protein [Pontibacter aquaedesilientis]
MNARTATSNGKRFRIPFTYKFLNPYFYIYALERRLNHYHDKRLGVDFTKVDYKPNVLGLNPAECYSSEPSGNVFLGRILKDLKIGKNDSIIDIGCGKGSALRYMMKFPFARIAGLEISALLSSIAQQNFEKLKAKHITIYVGDATTFDNLDDFNYIYFYNPFPGQIMEKFIRNLKASIEINPRKVTIIYDYPTCHQEIIASGIFKTVSNKTYRNQQGFDIKLYTNEV